MLLGANLSINYAQSGPSLRHAERAYLIVDNPCVSCIASTYLLSESDADCDDRKVEWEVIIDLMDDGQPDYEFKSTYPTSNTAWNDSDANGIPDIYIPATDNNEVLKLEFEIDQIISNTADHSMQVLVKDACGQSNTYTLALNIVSEAISATPNPFHHDCLIDFVLPYDMAIAVNIWDMDGRLLRHIKKAEYAFGYNAFRLSETNLPEFPSVVIVQLIGENYEKTFQLLHNR